MKFYESEYEEALVDLLQQEGWEYTHGGNIRRNNRDISHHQRPTSVSPRTLSCIRG